MRNITSRLKPKRNSSRPFLVLMYHRVNDHLPRGEWVVPINDFCKQMRYLKSVAGHKDIDILLTFDDGYRDIYLNAYPVLREFGFTAIVFLITSMIGTNKKRKRYGVMPAPDMLSWKEVEKMQKNGFVFGAHTHTHPRLSQLTYGQQKKEIENSFNVLNSRLSTIDYGRLFCYPYGDYDRNTLSILKKLDADFAFTTQEGLNVKGFKPLELRRIGITGFDNLEKFKIKIRKCFN